MSIIAIVFEFLITIFSIDNPTDADRRWLLWGGDEVNASQFYEDKGMPG